MKIYVDLDHVDITEYTQIESGEYNTNKINFIFTPEYKDLVKVAIFGCKLDTDEPKFYKIYLSDDSCYLPLEVTTASDVISIGVYAFNVVNGELKLRYSPTPVKTIVYEGSFREEAENSSSPTPTEIEQIMSRIISLEEITSDLNTRVEALENKACDLYSIKEDVETLKSDVEGISGRLDTVESDIDDLEGDIANTYSKTEVDTLLGAKVDTTTFNESQAAQDEKIAKAELILSQLPKVTGEGTNISISPTIEYDLEVGSYKGDTKQDTLTGINLANTNETIEPTTINGITYSLENGVFSFSGTPSGATTITLTNSFPLKAGTYTIAILEQTGSYTGTIGKYVVTKPYTVRIDGNVLSQVQARTTTEDCDNCYISFYIGGNVTFTNLKFKLILVSGTYTSSTLPNWEPYCGGIPSPNPNYPQDIQVVTGTQTITISNADNTETQSYTLHLGDEELAKIGTAQDKIYYDNGKWYKTTTIPKTTLTSDMCSSVTASASYGALCYLNFNGKVDNSNICAMSNKFVGVSYDNRTSLPTGYRVFTSDGSGAVTIRFPNNSTIDTLQEVKDFVDNNVIEIRYVSYSPSTTEITNTTLLQDLNYIKEHIKSFSDTTNISTTGNLPIIITASALKQLS